MLGKVIVQGTTDNTLLEGHPNKHPIIQEPVKYKRHLIPSLIQREASQVSYCRDKAYISIIAYSNALPGRFKNLSSHPKA